MEIIMFVRTIAAAALSVAVLSSGAAFAASAGFDALLADTRAAAVGVTASQADRSERDLANTYITMARSLAAQGEEAKALDLLNFARGKLGLAGLEPVTDANRVASGKPVVQVGEIAPHNSAH